MTSPIADLDTALYTHLAADPTLTTELGGTAIYNRLAPPDTPLPCVIFQWQGGGDQHLTPSRMRNVVYTVKAVSTSLSQAASIDAALDAALHHQTLSVTGWTNFWLARQQDIAYTEVGDDGQPIHHTGATYRIRLAQ